MTHLRHRPSSERTGFVRDVAARALGSGGLTPGLAGRVPPLVGRLRRLADRSWAPVAQGAPNDDRWDSALLPHPMPPCRPTLWLRPALSR